MQGFARRVKQAEILKRGALCVPKAISNLTLKGLQAFWPFGAQFFTRLTHRLFSIEVLKFIDLKFDEGIPNHVSKSFQIRL